MTTKVEQLVMGAFWEAARRVSQSEGNEFTPPGEVEERYAYHVAELIRTRGIESYDTAKSTMKTFVSCFRGDAARLRELATGLG